LEEGLEETLILNRLGMFCKLVIRFKTTNSIENIMPQIGIHKDRVSYWKNSDQRKRWVETALKTIDPKLRVICGYRHLKEFREAMKNLNLKENTIKVMLGIVQFQSTIGLYPIYHNQIFKKR
jgi:hypothetical protein